LLTACDQPASHTGTAAECAVPTTPIATVQGTNFTSPLLGQQVTVQGVVTFAGAEGLYIESLQPDTDQRSSEGLFLSVPGYADTPPGTVVVASGTVEEVGEARDSLTSLGGISAFSTCADHHALPIQPARLPLPLAQREWVEGMRLQFHQPLLVTDVYRLAQGEMVLSAERILPTPTELARPGDDAREAQQANRANSLYLRLPGPPAAAFPVGSSLVELVGVLGNTGRGPQMQLAEQPRVTPPRLYAIQPAAPDDLRLMALNLHNYFNGDGLGGGFPTPRGGATAAEFAEQRRRIGAIVQKVQPHVLAVMELENDGFGPGSAMSDLLDDLRAATGADWLAARPRQQRIGGDAITTGIAYRADALQAVGDALALDTAPFDLLNRPPLAQRFRLADGSEFWVVVNHFKSKGSCPQEGRDNDLRDGQGCWNQARTLAAHALADWTATLAPATQGRVLLLGDFNAYRMEDPVQVLLRAGYNDLTAPDGLSLEYSFVYQGQAGTLDHAFATPALARSVQRAEILHVSAGWPPGMPLPHDWLGASDHDPVIVDLRARR
jgi:predicted extracellular nuclease